MLYARTKQVSITEGIDAPIKANYLPNYIVAVEAYEIIAARNEVLTHTPLCALQIIPLNLATLWVFHIT